MKMIYVAALMAGTALAPAGAFAQQTPAAVNTQNAASQAGQINPAMTRVQEHIQRAMQALDNDDMQAARQAVQEARRQLARQAENGARNTAATELREPLQQAEQALSQQNAERAEEALGRVEEQMASMDRQRGQGGADVVVEDEASIRVEVPEPDVTVRQANPRVAVQQPQPEIIVHQPAPTVTVDIPQPQITVRMPEPEVNVSQAQPQVEVEQGQPRVDVSESQPQVRTDRDNQEQANVQVQRSGQPVVNIQEAEQRAQVRYSSEEAQVRVNRAEGEPEVRFEDQNRQQATNDVDRMNRNASEQQARTSEDGAALDEQNTAAISPGQARDDLNTAIGAGSTRDVALTVNDIKDYDIVGANGNNLGDIEDVVNVNNRLYAVVTSGGFLGLGENRAAVPLSALYVTDQETLLAPDVSQRQIDGMANFQSDRYEALPDDHPVTLGAQ
ncbi:PRC-barrel domain-containing protein [Rhizobium halophilum]|uniref:PRC-barrel domain-containing protein n=1 Tax=Rhizobium halophilum TaxID=2846852 RepID=UPI001EFC312B|nr:PRC-barrel domain-containing protein [Rhizobium halophilum]MCF6370119.1 PRC-barrel domain-containing protein [Rhizobium halophilum]